MPVTITGGVSFTGNGVTMAGAPPSQATAGWYAGGNTGSLSTVQRITFATDTATATVRGPLSAGTYDMGATGTLTYGWYGGGGNPNASTTVTRITFATDSAISTNRGPLNRVTIALAATTTDTYGWFGGGYNASGQTLSGISRVTYATDTNTATGVGPLSLDQGRLAATGDGTTYGWFGGGNAASIGVYSIVNRITYASDTNTSTTRGPLSLARRNLSATGNTTDGWYAGGLSPSTVSTVDRITYATDTATASVRGPLTSIRFGLTASCDNTYGWFGGGYSPSATPGTLSQVNRITFATDTTTATTRGSLATSAYGLSATSGLQ